MKYRNFWEFRLENMPFPQTEIDSYVHELEQNHGKTLDQLMQDKKFVRDLRRKTKNIFHAPTYRSLINRTSVMMLHKPACQDNYSCGTLLTGDVELHCGDTARILDDAGQNHELLVLQYPHHGGYCGCKCRFLNLRATYNVLSYGCSNKHGHPYQDVIASLPPNETVHVNERCIFSYTIP